MKIGAVMFFTTDSMQPAALGRALEERGFEVRPLGFTEFIKSGGSAKCLTLRVDGEEAASWKQGARSQ